MKQFLPAFLETAIESIVNRTRVSAFHHGRAGLRHRFNILFERLRPNAITEPQSLTGALYQRPTKDGEQLLAYLLRQPIRDVTALLASNRAHNSVSREAGTLFIANHWLGNTAAKFLYRNMRTIFIWSATIHDLASSHRFISVILSTAVQSYLHWDRMLEANLY